VCVVHKFYMTCLCVAWRRCMSNNVFPYKGKLLGCEAWNQPHLMQAGMTVWSIHLYMCVWLLAGATRSMALHPEAVTRCGAHPQPAPPAAHGTRAKVTCTPVNVCALHFLLRLHLCVYVLYMFSLHRLQPLALVLKLCAQLYVCVLFTFCCACICVCTCSTSSACTACNPWHSYRRCIFCKRHDWLADCFGIASCARSKVS
jgi:hypothetical protein